MNDWKDNLTKLVPYEAGRQLDEPDVVKLNANENPYPPSPEVSKAIAGFDYSDLKVYPPLGTTSLDEALAEFHDIDIENILCGNSSDEILSMCFRAFFNSDKPVLFPDVTYSFYPVWCEFYGIPYKEVPLTDSFEVNIDDFAGTVNGGIIIPNPNAPTAVEMDLDNIQKLLRQNTSSVVIIDEAYVDFADVSALSLINKYENLLITRTMSKSRSLAGLRVGYAMGSKCLIRALKAAMHSFNAYPLSNLSIALASASVKDKTYFYETIGKIKETREHTSKKLKDKGFDITESKTNFLFIRHDGINAENLYKFLLDRKILVRHFSKDKISDHLRVTIGTETEMEIFLGAVNKYMEVNDVI